MNVGASRPEDAGLYFSWGNVEGVSADDAAAVEAMTEDAYATTTGASVQRDLTFATEDAAMAIMGNTWCMPDDEDLQELFDECDWEWVTVNGVNGYRVKSKQPGNTNSIFLPAAGTISDGELNENNVSGYYWSSKYDSAEEAMACGFVSDRITANQLNARYQGFTIRARLA